MHEDKNRYTCIIHAFANTHMHTPMVHKCMHRYKHKTEITIIVIMYIHRYSLKTLHSYTPRVLDLFISRQALGHTFGHTCTRAYIYRAYIDTAV